MLTKIIDDLRLQNRDKRVFSFEFEQQRYWLKQLEKPKGAMRLVKYNPQRAFIKEKLRIQQLNEMNAPVPKMVAAGEDFFVLQDAGRSVQDYIFDPQIADEKKQAILYDAAAALAKLHQQSLTHGRPAIRDMLWQDGVVRFIDFEANSNSKNLTIQIIRDILVFVHSLFKDCQLHNRDIQQIMQVYQNEGGRLFLQQTYQFIHKYRFLYYLLLPFQPVARTDLIAIMQVFCYFLDKECTIFPKNK